MLKYILIATVLTISASTWAKRKCSIIEDFPHTEDIRLSNGDIVPLPTKSADFDVLAFMGSMKYQKVVELLRREGSKRFPLKVGKDRAMASLMVYHYGSSDMEEFNEVYFLVPTSTKKTKGFLTSFWQLKDVWKKANRETDSEISFYYFKVFSGTKTAQLASQEIWRIKSIHAQINVTGFEKKSKSSFSISVGGKEWMSYSGEKTRYWIPTSARLNLFIAGTDPLQSGPVYSPVISCGKFKSAFYKKKKHKITVGDNPLGDLYRNLEFKPFMIALGRKLKAVQFGPRFNFID